MSVTYTLVLGWMESMENLHFLLPHLYNTPTSLTISRYRLVTETGVATRYTVRCIKPPPYT